MGRAYFTGALGQENIHISLHDDFYDWTPAGASVTPAVASVRGAVAAG
jgi:hypothetical protein